MILLMFAFGFFMFMATAGCSLLVMFMPPEISREIIYMMMTATGYFGSVILKLIHLTFRIVSFMFQAVIPQFILVFDKVYRLFSRLVQGLFLVADTATNGATWVMMICGLILVIDRQFGHRERQGGYHDQHPRPPNQNVRYQVPNNIVEEEDDIADNILDEERDNDRNSRGEIERQFELENTENENEANAIGEAQRTNQNMENIDNESLEIRNLRTGRRPSVLERFHSRMLGRSDSEMALCVVCLERNRNVAVFPCGHTHTCFRCVRLVMSTDGLCPMCRSDIVDYKHIFI